MDQAKVVSLCRALVRLVDEPQPGLASWHAICARTVDELREELAAERAVLPTLPEAVRAGRVPVKRPTLDRLAELETYAPDEDCPEDARFSLPVSDLRDLLALIPVVREDERAVAEARALNDRARLALIHLRDKLEQLIAETAQEVSCG